MASFEPGRGASAVEDVGVDIARWQQASTVVPKEEEIGTGPIGLLFNSVVELMSLILIDMRTQPDISQHYQSLESSSAALFFWGTDMGVSRGELDELLQDSPELRDTCLLVLVSIGHFIMCASLYLLSSEDRQQDVLASTGIPSALEQAMHILGQPSQTNFQVEQDEETLCRTLRMKIDTLVMLGPSLASPAQENFDDEEPRAIENVEELLPEQAYINNVAQRFPLAESAVVNHLGKLNWERYNHMLHLQREAIHQELGVTTMEKAKTIFHDSALGTSVPANSEAGFNMIMGPSGSQSMYAPSMVSTRAEQSHRRLPPLPAKARSGNPFTCAICNKAVVYKRTKAWKKHIFADLLAYACIFTDCSVADVFFEDQDAMMKHLEERHGLDVSRSKVACPLCVEYSTDDRDALSLHFARHMEEIALAILPSNVDSDDESANDTPSESEKQITKNPLSSEEVKEEASLSGSMNSTSPGSTSSSETDTRSQSMPMWWAERKERKRKEKEQEEVHKRLQSKLKEKEHKEEVQKWLRLHYEEEPTGEVDEADILTAYEAAFRTARLADGNGERLLMTDNEFLGHVHTIFPSIGTDIYAPLRPGEYVLRGIRPVTPGAPRMTPGMFEAPQASLDEQTKSEVLQDMDPAIKSQLLKLPDEVFRDVLQMPDKRQLQSVVDSQTSQEEVMRCVCGNADYRGSPFSFRLLKASNDRAHLPIQCSVCKVWQHRGCVGLQQAANPDQYFCEQCRHDFHGLYTDARGQKYSKYDPARPFQSMKAQPNEPRMKRSRTKTGCGTCRRRGKKCDETKPECNNCVRGSFICEGYRNKIPWPKKTTERQASKNTINASQDSTEADSLPPIHEDLEAQQQKKKVVDMLKLTPAQMAAMRRGALRLGHLMPTPEDPKNSPMPEPSSRPRPSSYWSISEQAAFHKYVAHFGTNWAAIAEHMETKTARMIKNQYLRILENGRDSELERLAEEADVRHMHGEDIGPPPLPTPTSMRWPHATVSRRAPSPGPHNAAPTTLHDSQRRESVSRDEVASLRDDPPLSSHHEGSAEDDRDQDYDSDQTYWEKQGVPVPRSPFKHMRPGRISSYLASERTIDNHEPVTPFPEPHNSLHSDSLASVPAPIDSPDLTRHPFANQGLGDFRVDTQVVSDGTDAPKPNIKFKDALGRKFSFPWNMCKTWKGMEELIKQAFLHVDTIGPRVHEGHYDLVGPDGEVILPVVWETMVQPDWSITMHMWPMPEGPFQPPPPPKEPEIVPMPPGEDMQTQKDKQYRLREGDTFEAAEEATNGTDSTMKGELDWAKPLPVDEYVRSIPAVPYDSLLANQGTDDFRVDTQVASDRTGRRSQAPKDKHYNLRERDPRRERSFRDVLRRLPEAATDATGSRLSTHDEERRLFHQGRSNSPMTTAKDVTDATDKTAEVDGDPNRFEGTGEASRTAQPPFPPPPLYLPPIVPEGWKVVWNTQYSQWFYVNMYTKQSQWEEPTHPVYPTGEIPLDGRPHHLERADEFERSPRSRRRLTRSERKADVDTRGNNTLPSSDEVPLTSQEETNSSIEADVDVDAHNQDIQPQPSFREIWRELPEVTRLNRSERKADSRRMPPSPATVNRKMDEHAEINKKGNDMMDQDTV